MVAYGQSSKFIWKRDFPMKTEFVFGAKITTKKKNTSYGACSIIEESIIFNMQTTYLSSENVRL